MKNISQTLLKEIPSKHVFFFAPQFSVLLFELPSSTQFRKIAKSEKFDLHQMSDFSFQYIPMKIYLKSLYSLDIIMLIMPS